MRVFDLGNSYLKVYDVKTDEDIEIIKRIDVNQIDRSIKDLCDNETYLVSTKPSLEKFLKNVCTNLKTISYDSFPSSFKPPYAAYGIDRLIGLYSAFVIYGEPVMVISFGTAITFDILSKGVIIGGITLGLSSKMKALREYTENLSHIKIENLSFKIPSNTNQSVELGFYLELYGIVDFAYKEFNVKTIIKTGADSVYIRDSFLIDEPYLLPKGVYFLKSSK